MAFTSGTSTVGLVKIAGADFHVMMMMMMNIVEIKSIRNEIVLLRLAGDQQREQKQKRKH